MQHAMMSLSMMNGVDWMDGTIRRMGIILAGHDRPLNGFNIKDL